MSQDPSSPRSADRLPDRAFAFTHARPEISRRMLLGALPAAALVVGTGTYLARRGGPAEIGLYSDAVAYRSAGERELVPAGRSNLLTVGSRVFADSPDHDALLDDARRWSEDTEPWVRESPWSELHESALADMWSLHTEGVLADGVTQCRTSVAAWSTHWRYVWPRDAAHVAAAYAAVGKPEEAVEQLRFFQGRQRSDNGWFEARYLPGSLGVPDAREPQLDGIGWLLWACGTLDRYEQAPEYFTALRPLIDHCTEVSLEVTADGLPPVSADYWEVPEWQPVLGVSAPLLAGLQHAGRIHRRLGDTARAQQIDEAASALERIVRRTFGARGYPRRLNGRHQDTAVAFMLPPYTLGAAPEAHRSARQARDSLTQPAGGVSPGGDWRDDQVSWTPETAVFGLVAAAGGDHERAEDELRWLRDHRTASGALPEKVLADHSPAAVAPLGWTASLVLLTGYELARR